MLWSTILRSRSFVLIEFDRIRRGFTRAAGIFSMLSGLLGIGLIQVLGTQHWVWISIGVVLLFLVIIALTPKGSEVIGKRAISERRTKLLHNANKSIDILAGDGSWLHEEWPLLKQKLDLKIPVRILAETLEPGPIKMFQEAGAEVKIYPAEFDPNIRGLLLDKRGHDRFEDRNVLYIVRKDPKNAAAAANDMHHKPGDDASYEYRGRVYNPNEDPLLVRGLSQLFDALWDLAKKQNVAGQP
jgi:hypothetical protein